MLKKLILLLQSIQDFLYSTFLYYYTSFIHFRRFIHEAVFYQIMILYQNLRFSTSFIQFVINNFF